MVSSFTKMTDKFVDHFLTHDGESVEEAKKRLAATGQGKLYWQVTRGAGMGRPDFLDFPLTQTKYSHFCGIISVKFAEGCLMFQILVVEDDSDLNRTVCSFLNQSGYVATGCLRASDAYNALYQSMFDLIVSDIMMPEIDGFEFARTVRSLDENIPILFMTARDDFASKQSGGIAQELTITW